MNIVHNYGTANYQLKNHTSNIFLNSVQFQSRIAKPRNMKRGITNMIENGQISEHFVPTPVGIVDMMISELGVVKPSDRVLEPSAGYGHVADRLTKRTHLPKGSVDVIEPVKELRAILAQKGYNLAGTDILNYNPKVQYDKVVMNPPFDNGSDILHLMYCYKLLKPGGKLVAILPENCFLPTKQKGYKKWVKDWFKTGEKKEINSYLRDLLNSTKSKTIKLGNAFEKSDVPDNVQTRMVVIEKPSLHQAGN